jgi:hypothetical protein
VADGAGWFADPSGKINTFRWWDGQAWTRWLSADPTAADPGPVADPGVPTSPAPDFPPPDEATAYAPPDAVKAGPAALAPPDPGDRMVGLPAAAAVLVGGVLLAIIAVGAIISLTADRPLTGPAVAPPPPTETPLAVTYNAGTRTGSVEELKVALPAAPFSCASSPTEIPGLFASAVSCDVAVHPDYDKEKNDWGASVGLGLLEPERDTERDLRQLLASTASAVLARNYEVDDLTVKRAKNRTSDVASAGRARVVTAELHVSNPGLPTKYDAMRVVIVRLESGRHVAWWGLVPDDSPEEVRMAVAASAESITARK